MAAISLNKYAVRVEGELCPNCFKSSLWWVILQKLDMDGITPYARRMACLDERKWIGPQEDLPDGW